MSCLEPTDRSEIHYWSYCAAVEDGQIVAVEDLGKKVLYLSMGSPFEVFAVECIIPRQVIAKADQE